MGVKNKAAMVTAIVSGVLLIAAGVSGIASWETIKYFVTTYILDNYVVQVAFAALIFIASLGGISVIIGGLLLGKGSKRTGKFIIGLGTGMGIIGLFFSFLTAFFTGSFTVAGFFSTGTIGIILSVIARQIAK